MKIEFPAKNHKQNRKWIEKPPHATRRNLKKPLI